MLNASVTPDVRATFDPAIYLVKAPASNCDLAPKPCLAGDDSGPATATNTVSYTNASANEETVFIVVDDSSADRRGGAFSLTTSIAPAR